MISGMYMGEIARLILVKLTNEKILFGGKGSDLLFTRGQFFTKYVSEIELDQRGTYTNCQQILEEIGLSHATEQDCVNIRYVCECVSRRAAHLVSAGIATLINKMDMPQITVGVDGSVYRFHPHFHKLMMEKINQLVKPNIKVTWSELTFSKDHFHKNYFIFTVRIDVIGRRKRSWSCFSCGRSVPRTKYHQNTETPIINTYNIQI